MRLSKKNSKKTIKRSVRKNYINLKGGRLIRITDITPTDPRTPFNIAIDQALTQEQITLLTELFTVFDICIPTTLQNINMCKNPNAFYITPFDNLEFFLEQIRVGSFNQFVIRKKNAGVEQVTIYYLNELRQPNFLGATSNYNYDTKFTNIEVDVTYLGVQQGQAQQWINTKFLFDSGNDAQTQIGNRLVNTLGLARKQILAETAHVLKLTVFYELIRPLYNILGLPTLRISYNLRQARQDVEWTDYRNELLTTTYYIDDGINPRKVTVQDLLNIIDIIQESIYNYNNQDIINRLCMYFELNDPHVFIMLPLPANPIVISRNGYMAQERINLRPTFRHFKDLMCNYLGIPRTVGVGGVSAPSTEYVDLKFRFSNHNMCNFITQAHINYSQTLENEVLVSIHDIKTLSSYKYHMVSNRYREHKILENTKSENENLIMAISSILSSNIAHHDNIILPGRPIDQDAIIKLMAKMAELTQLNTNLEQQIRNFTKINLEPTP